MDKIYIGDIPLTFCYAQWGNNYVDLYNTPTLQGNLERYRVYFFDNTFVYSHGYSNFSYNSTQIAEYVQVTQDFVYRRDFSNIVQVSFVFILVIVLLFNMVTSVFKRGGIFSGLL